MDSPNSYFEQGSSAVEQKVSADLASMTKPSKWSLPQKVAIACRILAEHGHSLTLAGQITARSGEADGFWTTSFATGFADATAHSILKVDSMMQRSEGEGVPNPGVRFHAWIYRARPEVGCIVHTHPPFAAALSMTGEALVPAHMDAMMFFEDCAFLPDWPGVPLANKEGEIITRALGTKCSILLAHHGILTVGETLEEAVYLAVLLERAAQLHLLARAAGQIRVPGRELAMEAHDFLLKRPIIDSTFDYWARLVLAKYPETLSTPVAR